MIEVLHKVLKLKLREKVLDAGIYTLMMDGSSDCNWKEIEGIVVRFINKKGDIEEHAIGVKEANDRSAQGLLALMTSCLNDMDIPLDGAVAQCYDGASVMSGHRGGLQKFLSEKSGRNIIYVHCFCHRLHLVVRDIIDTVMLVSEHYSLLSSLYNCMKLADVKAHYVGIKLKRLLETRWSGHRDCVLAIDREIKEIIDCLSTCCSSADVKSDHRVLARGLHTQVTQPSFILLNKFLSEFLNQINIANLVCQSKSSNITNVLSAIQECRSEISSLKDAYDVDKLTRDFKVLKEQYSVVRRPTSNEPFLHHLMDLLPIESRSVDGDEDADVIQELRSVIVELSDCFEREMETRFTTENTNLWSSMDALSFTNTDFLDPSLIRPLFDYMLTVPKINDKLCSLRVDDFTALQSECKVFKNVIVRKFEKCTNVDVGDIYVFISENCAEAAPVLTSLYKLSITCGYASARVECLFSAMSYVDAPRRQCSKSERKCALTHLYFEREMVKNITFAEFSEEWLKKPRSLFL